MLLTGVFFYAGGIAVRGAAVSQTCQSEGLEAGVWAASP